MKRPDVQACIKLGPGRYSFGDSMSLVVRGGSALFEYQYREDKKTKTLVLGSAIGPAALTITAAREARGAAWLARRNGIGLAMPGIRIAQPRGDVFGEAAATYLENHADLPVWYGCTLRRLPRSPSTGSPPLKSPTSCGQFGTDPATTEARDFGALSNPC